MPSVSIEEKAYCLFKHKWIKDDVYQHCKYCYSNEVRKVVGVDYPAYCKTVKERTRKGDWLSMNELAENDRQVLREEKLKRILI